MSGLTITPKTDTNNNTTITGSVPSGSTDSGNPVKIGGVYNSTKPTLTNGQRGDAQLDTRSNLQVAIFGVDGANGVQVLNGQADGRSNNFVTLLTAGFNYVFNGTTWDRATGTTSGANTVARAVTSGGYSITRLGQAAANNAAAVKASAGQIYGYSFGNNGGSPAYVKFYNKTTTPNPASDTPALVVMVPAGGNIAVDYSCGLPFSTGIGIAVVTGASDTDNTGVAANQVVGEVYYK